MYVYLDSVKLIVVNSSQVQHIGVLSIQCDFMDIRHLLFNFPFNVIVKEKNISTIAIKIITETLRGLSYPGLSGHLRSLVKLSAIPGIGYIRNDRTKCQLIK